MANVHVFNAGPCLLPQQAIDNSIEALKNFKAAMGYSDVTPDEKRGFFGKKKK